MDYIHVYPRCRSPTHTTHSTHTTHATHQLMLLTLLTVLPYTNLRILQYIYMYIYIYIGVNPQCLEFDESQPWASILKSKLSIGVYIRQFKTIYSTI